MSATDPYAAPKSNIRSEPENSAEDEIRLQRLASGQKLVLYAVLLYFIAVAARYLAGPIVILLVLPSLILSLIGMYKVLAASNSHAATKVLLFILLFVPLINLLVLLRINARATKELREAGYKVGLMGASK